MSIATELQNYQTFLTNAYNTCADRGAVIPQNKNLQNLSSCIDSIPTLYTPLEYIESTGTQYINTNISLGRFKISGTITITGYDSANSYNAVFGNQVYSNGWITNFVRMYTPRNGWQVCDTYAGADTVTLNTKLVFEASTANSGQYLIVNGNTIISPTTVTSNPPANDIYLCALNDNNSGAGQFSKVRIFNIKIYDTNDNLLGDFIPVLDYRGIPCLYEKINHTFHYNQGTGSFNYN